MAFNPAKLIAQVFQGASSRILGGALGGALIVLLAFRLSRSFGARYVIAFVVGLVAAVFLMFLIVVLWRYLQRRRGKSMENELEKQRRKDIRLQDAAAVSSIRERWDTSMSTLKNSGLSIYELPWILLIGEPQSGKTTTLRGSGLDFPVGKDALSGSGGTVNCDWWFSNDAVIIDTAGRFTMPVDSAPDKKEWDSFLKLLARKRPQCPINGVIVTIPANSLLEDNLEEIKDKAEKIHDKLVELLVKLGVEYPIYIMVSKLDLVFGFAEFFESLSSVEQTQIVGWNRKTAESRPFDAEEFSHFFEDQTRRFYLWSLRRLRSVPPNQGDRAYSFPWEFKRIKNPLERYLEVIFRADRYRQDLLWRGCFFSSGLQEGQAISSALLNGVESSHYKQMEHLAHSFVESRPYFIHTFYKKVFIERGLVKRVARLTRREKGFRIGAGMIAGLFFIISGLILAFGYSSLSKTLWSINKSAINAEEIANRVEHSDPVEVFNIIKEIEKGQSYLEMDRPAKLFLGINKKGVSRDLENIAYVLSDKGVISRFLASAGKKMGEIQPKNLVEEDALADATGQYLSILSGAPLSNKSLHPILAVHTLETDEWEGLARNKLNYLWASYHSGDDAFQKRMKIKGGEKDVLEILSHINYFWNHYPSGLWGNMQRRVGRFAEAYENFINKSEKMDKNVGFPNFQEEIRAIKELARQLKKTGSGGEFISPLILEKTCSDEYERLKNSLSNAYRMKKPPGAIFKAIEMDRGVCGELNLGTGKIYNSRLPQYRNVWLEDGSINPELEKIIGALELTADFGPLFSEKERWQLMAEQENALTLFYAWSKQWETAKIAKMKEILEKMDTVSSKVWKKGALISSLDHFLTRKVWAAERDIVLTAAKHFLKNDAMPIRKLRSGEDPPFSARAIWLESRFKLLLELERAIRIQNPAHPGQRGIASAVKNEMLKAYRDCLKFWSQTIKVIDPATKILSVSDWASYRRQVILLRGIFLDPAAWPLNIFREHISIDSLNRLRSLTGERRGNDILRLERNVIRTAYVYGVSRHLENLEKFQAVFFQCVESLPDDASLAWKILQKKRVLGNEEFDIHDFMALAAFRGKVERDPLSRGEQLSMRLEKVAAYGLSLLKGSAVDNLEKDWNYFLTTWKNKMDDRFPFGGKTEPIDVDTNGNLKTIRFATVSPREIHDFFFHPQNGLETFIRRHGTGIGSGRESSLNSFWMEDRKIFIKRCLAWKKFLFDDAGKPKAHHVAIRLDDQENSSDFHDGRSQFTVLYMDGLQSTEPDARLRLRFSGSRYKDAKINWNVGDVSEIVILAENEETGKQASARLTGGPLALLTYIYANGNKTDIFGDAIWRVAIRLPDSERTNELHQENISIKLSFQWAETFPEPIRWAN